MCERGKKSVVCVCVQYNRTFVHRMTPVREFCVVEPRSGGVSHRCDRRDNGQFLTARVGMSLHLACGEVGGSDNTASATIRDVK